MSIAKDIENSTDVIFPPGDLYSDEPQLESYLHLQQMLLLFKCLEWWWRERNDFFVAGNLTVYYSPHQRKSEDFRGPDFFVVLGTERKPRKSWVVWEEYGKYPNIIIELLSSSTASVDKGVKKQIYQDIFRTPDYFWFDPNNLEFAGFVLVSGKYQPLEPNGNGWLWSHQLGLFLGVYEQQLRFFTSSGQLVPTPEEVAQKEIKRAQEATQFAQEEQQRAQEATHLAQREMQRAQEATQLAQEEQQRAERLAAKLRELNIDPDTV
ncbi:MAG: Uma2 family endonuclease [Cyanobacteria bacterium P01_A01_bin.84]